MAQPPEVLGIALAKQLLSPKRLLRVDRIVSPDLIGQARNTEDMRRIVREHMAQELARAVVRQPTLYRATTEDKHNIGGEVFTLDTVVLSPEEFYDILAKAWREGFAAQEYK